MKIPLLGLCLTSILGFAIAISFANAQALLTGKVTDIGGNPVVGTTILVKGTTTATIASVDGEYRLKLPTPNCTLVFSSIGYKTVEKNRTNETVIDVVMVEDNKSLDEVVVVGYGTVKKSDLTGSITSVSTKDIKNSSILSADQAMQGRAAGVLVVNNSGAPGSPVSIKIRGIGSFGNTDPLYVVDGMPVKDGSFGKDDNPSGISFLNPNDIESIQILKDASAAAIYGTRGANGVILITTKRGKSGKMRVEIENYVGMQKLARNIDVLDAEEFAKIYKEVKTDNTIFPDELTTTNWVNEILQTAPVYNNQVNISGGKENSTFYLSFNNYKQKGIIQGSGFDRQSVRLNSENKINNWLKIGQNLTMMQSDRNRQMEGSNGVVFQALKSDPTRPIYDETGNWSYLARTGSNPVGVVERNNYNYLTTRIQGSFFAEIEFIKNLKYKLNAGIDRSWAKKTDFTPKFFIAGPEKNETNTLSEGHDSWNNWLLENTLSYNYTLDLHHVEVLAGYTSQFERKETTTLKVYLPSSDPEMRYVSNKKTLEDISMLNGEALEWALISQLGRLNYTYGEKYLLTASIRRDGSSRFGANRKYGIFPSWSMAWKISNEEFFKNIEAFSDINLFKLRFGWGKVGNQNIDAYAYLGSVSNAPDSGRDALQTYFGLPKNTVPVYVDKTLPNSEIGWETSVMSIYNCRI